MNNNLQAVREAVIEAVSSEATRNHDEVVRLADVLLADRDSLNVKIHQDEIIDLWNLTADDLNHQTPETISFLYDILCEKL